jgi:hypothetical protein
LALEYWPLAIFEDVALGIPLGADPTIAVKPVKSMQELAVLLSRSKTLFLL